MNKIDQLVLVRKIKYLRLKTGKNIIKLRMDG